MIPPLESESVVRGAHEFHMFTNQNTSIQQRRAAACLPQARRRMPALPLPLLGGDYEAQNDGTGCPGLGGARPVVSETKLAIVAVMQELDCPVTSTELREIWAEHKDLKVFEYHLSTLVTAKVAEVVYGPELHFRLTVKE